MRASKSALVRACLLPTCLAFVGCGSTQPAAPLAQPETTPASKPIQVGSQAAPAGGGPTIHQLALGDRHTCALMSDSRVLCWGANTKRQLGDGTMTDRLQATRATVVDQLGSDNLVSLTAGGDRTCVVAGETREWLCWGDLPGGVIRSPAPLPELANDRNEPQPLLRGVLGPRWVCGIRDGSEVVCRPNFQRGKPASIVSPTGFQTDTSLAVGNAHACLARGAGVLCWGDNRHGQLGDGTLHSRPAAKPTTVQHIVDGTQVVAGDDHTCIVTKTHRELGCWGANADGQLGTAAGSDRTSVLALPTLTPARTVSAAGTHTCALTEGSSGDELRCWGSWDTGQACRKLPLPQPTEADEIIDLAAGSNLCMATRGGLAICSETRYNG
ncbi:MAG: RCC1 domain-containing protein, partial [Nannocystaceae bacterium]